jgi:hypothetical protein
VNGVRTTNNAFVFNGIDVTNMLCCNSPDQRIAGNNRLRGRHAFPQPRARTRDA